MNNIEPEVIDRIIERLYHAQKMALMFAYKEVRANYEQRGIEFSELSKIEKEYRAFIINHDLVTLDGEAILTITQTARDVHHAGGWVKYTTNRFQKQENERIRQEEAHQAIQRSTTATEHSARSADSSAKAAWLAGVVAAVSIVFSVGQILWSGSTQQDLSANKAELNELKAQLRLLSQQVQKQKAIHSKNSYRLDSLPNPKMKNK